MRIPMYVEAEKLRVLVLGGGEEAEKKARRFLEHGAKVTVYSLDFGDWLREAGEKGLVKLVQGDVMQRWDVERLIAGSDLVIYTIPEIPEAERFVKETCEKHRKLYVLATNAEETMVAMPIEVRAAGLRIAVTSEGKSTLVAKWAAEEISKCLEGRRDIELMLDVMWEAKKLMKSRGISYKDRIRLYRSLFGDERLRSAVAEGDKEKALRIISEAISAHSGK
jgi:precorrin-2 dehydrogenase/sirohydrochlorin ferrochelatase